MVLMKNGPVCRVWLSLIRMTELKTGPLVEALSMRCCLELGVRVIGIEMKRSWMLNLGSADCRLFGPVDQNSGF